MRMRPAVALLLAGLSVIAAQATYASPVSRDYNGMPRAADSYRYDGGYYKVGRTLTSNLDFQGPPLDQGSTDDEARQGTPGPQGATGARGATGPQGATGARGATGPQGATGAAGIPGAAGVAGLQGSTGARGTTGPQGVTGARGATGAAGAPGTAGIAGPAGSAGPQGSTGARGATGAAGAPGTAGIAGPAGSAGPQGTTGARGATGAAGVPGVAGPVGPLGPAGPVGAPGTAGPQGTAGARGPTGPAGGPGPVGTPGPQGTTGAGGAAGNVGAAGPQGTTGARGATGGGGPQGTPGPRGPQGTPGADGFAGPAGPAGPEGPAGPAGPAGPEGPIGAPGFDGPTGPEGPAGPPGAAGLCASGQAYVARSTAQVTSMACSNTEVCVAAQCDGNPVINGGCSTGFSTPYCVDDHGVDADCATQSPTSNVVGWACGANAAEGLSATVTCCGTRPGQICADPRIAQTGVNSFDNTPATQQLWVPCSNNLLDKAVWYKWTAESDSIISVTTCQGQEAPGDTMLAVFNFCPDSEAAKKYHNILYTCNDNGGNCGSGSALAFRAFAGKAYYIVVGSVSGGDAVRGEFIIAPIEPSMGQLCVNPLTAQTGVNSFDNTLAVENVDGSCRVRKAIWYQWTAQWTSTVSVTTCQGEGSPGDTVLAVFSSCDTPDALTACNDDGGTCFSGSALAFSAVAGQTYFIAVGSYGEETLAGQLTIAPEPLIGSMCTMPKTAVVGENTFDTTQAIESRQLGLCTKNFLVDWFVFTAPESANYEVSTCQAGVDTVIYVYSGAECGSLEGINCSDGGYCPDFTWDPTTLGFAATSGETYWIVIGSFNGARFANQPWTIRNIDQSKALSPQKPTIPDPRPPQPDCPLCNPVDKPSANQTLFTEHSPLAQHANKPAKAPASTPTKS